MAKEGLFRGKLAAAWKRKGGVEPTAVRPSPGGRGVRVQSAQQGQARLVSGVRFGGGLTVREYVQRRYNMSGLHIDVFMPVF